MEATPWTLALAFAVALLAMLVLPIAVLWIRSWHRQVALHRRRRLQPAPSRPSWLLE